MKWEELKNDYLDIKLEDLNDWEEEVLEEEQEYMVGLASLLEEYLMSEKNNWMIRVENVGIRIRFNDMQSRGMKGKYLIEVFIKFEDWGHNSLHYSVEGGMLNSLAKSEECREDFMETVARQLRS